MDEIKFKQNVFATLLTVIALGILLASWVAMASTSDRCAWQYCNEASGFVTCGELFRGTRSEMLKAARLHQGAHRLLISECPKAGEDFLMKNSYVIFPIRARGS